MFRDHRSYGKKKNQRDLVNERLGMGGIDSSSKNLEMSLWRKHSKIPVHFLSLTFGSNSDGDLPTRFPRT
jgi:hypothetical protein